MVAGALRAFSLTSGTRQVYRGLGNTVGADRRSRAGLPDHYVERARWALGVFDEYGIGREGGRFLELGTGWVHWESTIVRLFHDAKITLFDVWDNRQLKPYKVYFSDYRKVLELGTAMPRAEREAALALLDAILSVKSHEELYDLLGFDYVVEPTGSLRGLASESYDVCFSYNVFEHIDHSILPGYLRDLNRLLKPGAYTFIHVDISDHLANYDSAVSRKNYLKYSDRQWDRWFENDVQYFNRVQRTEWLKLFEDAGFELVSHKTVCEPVSIRIDQQYEGLEVDDIECIGLDIVHRKPPLIAGT